MEQNSKNYKRNTRVQLILGIVLVLIGVAVLAELVDAVPWRLRDFVFTWQMLLIVLGIVFVSGKESKPTGYILIAVGAFFLLPRFIDLPYYWRSLFWPAILIVIGLVVIFHRGKGGCRSHPHRQSESEDDYLDDVAVFGGSDRIIHSKNFQGGKITNIFGGSKYDMRQVELAEGKQYLEVVMIFGGSKFVVPEGWNMKIEVTAIFGGFSDKRVRSKPDSEKGTLVIRGVTLFGGGEIVNF